MRKPVLVFIALLICYQITLAQHTVSGTVVNAENNQPLANVSISVKGNRMEAATNANGQYAINLPDTNRVLVFNYEGMQKVSINTGSQTNIDINMHPSEKREGYIRTYGKKRRIEESAGFVTQISMEPFKNYPVADIMDGLQGKVPGLEIYTSSGEPDAVSSSRLNHVNLGSSISPLYVLDGMPVSHDVIRSLNPNDFESITLLQDASETSIYGFRGGGGVILINSKKGSLYGAPSITVNVSSGFSQLSNDNFFDVMNSSQLKAHWLDLGLEDAADIEDVFAKGYDTKWSDVYYKDKVPTNQVDIAVSGGGKKTSYYISGSNFYQEGTAHRSEFKRSTVRANIESKINNWFKIGGNLVGSYVERQNNYYTYLSSNLLNGGLFWLAEPYVNPYDSNGNVMDRIPGLFGSTGTSPQYLAEKMPSKAKEYRGNGNLYVHITPFKGFTIRSLAGLDDFTQNIRSARMPSMVTNLNNGTLSLTYLKHTNLMLTNTIDYIFDFKKNNFSVLAGHEYYSYDNKGFSASASGIQSDDEMNLSWGNPELTSASSYSTEHSYISYFGRIGYNYNEKYYIDLSIRNDAPKNRKKDNATFYSIGALWNIKSEAFMSGVNMISNLKLKIAYGTSGNTFGSFYSDYRYTSQASNYGYGGSYIIGLNGTFSDDRQKSFSTSIDIELYKRFRVNFGYYHRYMITPMNLPYALTTGQAEDDPGLATAKNYGFNINTDIDILKGKDYYLNFNIIFNNKQNKVLSLFDNRQVWVMPNTGVAYVVGKPVEFYYPIFYRIDPADGQQEWYLPGDDFTVTQKDPTKTTKTYSYSLDQSTGIPRYAPISGGFGLSGGWKGFDLQVDFAFVYKKYMINNDRYFSENAYSFYGYNQSERVLDYWKQPGDVKDYPDWRQGQVMEFDTHLLEDASFLRLKNLTVGYSLPASLLSKTKIISGFRIYFKTRNLLTFTKYLGPDPEMDANLTYGAYPNSKQFVFGAEVRF